MSIIDMAFDLYDDNGNKRGTFEIQTNEFGSTLNVWAGGVKIPVSNAVVTFVESMLGQGYLFSKAQKEHERKQEGA